MSGQNSTKQDSQLARTARVNKSANARDHVQRRENEGESFAKNGLQVVNPLQGNLSHPSQHSTIVQPKMTVNAPDDQYEAEADRVADQVMRMPGGSFDGWGRTAPTAPTLQLKYDVMRDGEGATPAVTPTVERNIQALDSGGKPLDDESRDFFEQRIGADFSDVRIHTDSTAVQTSRDINARAFTVGNNIAFNSGQYNPTSSEGKHLLAHELTHTIQQGAAARVDRKPLVQREAETQTTDEPTPEEKAQALANAQAALAAASGVKSESIGQTATSQGQAVTEQSAVAAPQALVDASVAEGGIQETEKKALEQQSAEKALAQTAESEAINTAANDKANAAQQSAQAIPKPEAAPAPVEQQASPAPTGENLEGATATAQQTVAGAFANAANASDKAPSSTEEDPGYTAAQQAVVSTGEQQKTHDPADREAMAAQAAAVSPEQELRGQAQSAQVGDMEQAETPTFDAAAFKARLLEKIASLAPTSAEEADNLKESGKVDALKGDIQNEATQEKERSETPLEETTQAAPDMADAQPKEVTPLESADPGQIPAPIGADNATPKQKGEGEIETPVVEGNAALDQQMADANITEEQLANANEPEFSAALEAKNNTQTQTVAAAQNVRHGEQGLIANTEAEAVATAQTATQTMFETRTASLTTVQGQQEQTKTEDERAREKIANDINGIYENTKSKVDTILGALDGEVTALFDEGAQQAADAFENYVDSRMEAYKEERYGGMFGWAQWAIDKLAGMPSEVNVFYTEGRQLYIDKMDAVIDNVVALIGRTLAQAKAEVANGKREIQQYVDELPEHLREVGNQATQEIAGSFDALEQSINAKQDELINSLAQQYNENLQAIDARIEEMRAANQGLIAQAIDKIDGVIQTIIELKNMLQEVLSRAAAAIEQIIKDPIGFLSNLISAVNQGLQNFLSNIGEHLQKGLIGWLTGAIASAGIQMPDSFDLQGIFSLVMQVAGVGFEQIMGKLSARLGVDLNTFIEPVTQVLDIYQEGGLAGLAQYGLTELIGEENVQALMEVVDIVKMVLEGNFGALWERVKEYLSDLKEVVMGKIMEFITSEVIEQGIIWVISLFNPAGAFIKACKMIYDVVMFFVNNGRQIMALVNSVIDSVSAIASGNLGGAAAAIEQALANSIPAAIGFLSSLLGLGDIPNKIREIIQSVRGFVDDAIEKLLNLPPVQMVIGFIRQLIDKMRELIANGIDKVKEVAGGGETAETVEEAAVQASVEDGEIGETQHFSDGQEGHRLWVEVQGDTPVVMVASTKTKLKDLLASQEVQGLEDTYGHVGKVNDLADKIGEHADLIVAALTVSETEVETQVIETNDQLAEAGLREAVEPLKWIFNQIDNKGAVVKTAVLSIGIIEFLKSMARRESIMDVSHAEFQEVYDNDQETKDWLKDRFRTVVAGHHEWLPTDYLGEVVQLAHDADKFAEGVKWIDVQHEMRVKTEDVILTPSYWITFSDKLSPLAPEETFSIPCGHTSGANGLVWQGTEKPEYGLKPGSNSGLVREASGKGAFHLAFNGVFTNNKGNFPAYFAALEAEVKKWVWDGEVAPPANVHPSLYYGGASIADTAAFASAQQVRFEAIMQTIEAAKSKAMG